MPSVEISEGVELGSHGVAWLALLLLMVLQLAACSSKPVSLILNNSASITVAAASDLTDTLTELGRAFNDRGGSKVVFSFGSTGSLTRQIEEGAPFDVFVAANLGYIERLEKRRLVIEGTRHIFARGRITLWQRKDTTHPIDRLEELDQPGIRRVAIANPEYAPYGVAARQALERAGLWQAIRGKLVFAKNIAQCRQFVETGNVDAAILALSISNRTEGRFVLIDPSMYEPILQTVCILRRTSNEALCREWVAYLQGPEGKLVLGRYGFVF